MTTLLHLPNELLVETFTNLDLQSRLKFRVNKRLDELERIAPSYLQGINIQVSDVDMEYMCELTVTPVNGPRVCYSNTVDICERLLGRLAQSTCTKHVRFVVNRRKMKEIPLVDIVSKLYAERLFVHCNKSISQLPHHFFLGLAQRVEVVIIDKCCFSVTTEQLKELRETILDENYAVKRIELKVSKERANSFLKTCLGIAINDENDNGYRSREYRSDNQRGFQLFSFDPLVQIIHVEDNLITTIEWSRYDWVTSITFEECQEKPARNLKIDINTVYHRTP